MKYTITIPGKPTPLARPRFSNDRVYNAQRLALTNTGIFIRNQFKREPICEPVVMHITFFFKIPASHYKKRDEMLGTPLSHKPDLSNLVKFYEDAGNGILYKDDCVIVELKASKVYGDEEMTEITLIEWQK